MKMNFSALEMLTPMVAKCQIHACGRIHILIVQQHAQYSAERERCNVTAGRMQQDVQCQMFAFQRIQTARHLAQ
jgi:hypothetical protein